MRSLPVSLALSWDSHVSWAANVEEVSASSKLRIRSTKEGIDPVVMALILGIVTVGDRAFAVKGMALPSRMRLLEL